MRYAVLLILVAMYASGSPNLHFSDIVAGPATGNADGAGGLSASQHGAIVTIWGTGLGTGGKVYFKDSAGTVHEAAHVYYWKNADGALPGGPADLYTYHKMQEIAFSIPPSALGLGHIYVEVGGVASNEIRFTVNNGDIFFVKGTGSNSAGTGSWNNPWATFGYSAGATNKPAVGAGDLIYGVDVTETTYVQIPYSKDGTAENQIAIVAYPGSYLRIRNYESARADGITAYSGGGNSPEFWVVSKWDIECRGNIGIEPLRGGRVIGNRITDEYNGAGCADGGAGAICSAGKQDGAKVFGNYIHDWGCYNTSNQEHTTYFSVRWKGYDIEPVELGWNVMVDNWARFGIHFYDEHDCWGYKGTVKVHDNVVKNQVGPGFNIGAGCDEGRDLSGDFEVYNNLFIETGQIGLNNALAAAIRIYGRSLVGKYSFYNNVIYGYGEDTTSLNSADGAIYVDGTNLNFTWEFVNNIVVDTHNLRFATPDTRLWRPKIARNNLWYNGADANPASAPSWDSGSIFADPRFADAETGDFHLLSGSPGINSGFDARAIVPTDFLGISRPQNSFDLGIFETKVSCASDTTRDCPFQLGVCSGSRENCKSGEWAGCDHRNYGTNFDGAGEVRCSDGLDNDCDGQADLWDPSCHIPLVVSDVRNTTTQSSATITWSTQVLTSGEVFYDTHQTYYGDYAKDTNGTSHSIVLSGLTADTTYYYRVRSCDRYGNCNLPVRFSFKTRAGEFIGCGNGVIEPPEICDGNCHPADTGGCDGIDINELLAFINRWKQGSVTISDLLQAIRLWKGA